MSREVRIFRRTVWKYYEQHGRRLPWRTTRDPYRILVSEIMLQQTQVDRVIPYYRNFLKQFPTVRALADAPLPRVLRAWQGLGYNRRGKHLRDAARAIVGQHSGKVPESVQELDALPGVGPYTASAVAAFAWNHPSAFIETNIRTVLMHHFFPLRESVRDAELLALAEATLDRKNPREWYWALMDYGSYLKKQGVSLNRKSAHYKKQSAFKGSNRELRGKILKLSLSSPGRLSERRIAQNTKASPQKIASAVHALKAEGLL